MHARATDLDIGVRFHVAAVSPDLSDEPVRTFQAIRELLVSNGTLTKEGRLNKDMAAKLGWTVRDVEPVLQKP